MSGFRFRPLEIPDVILIEPQWIRDERGFFLESYRRSAFDVAGLTVTFVQDNHAHSVRGVLRGLHFQNPPHAQGKLVHVVVGEIFDVAIDIRRRSPMYGRWIATTLSEANHRLLYVPPGFAHGYCVLSESANVEYKVTSEYAPEAERGVIWNDPDLAIAWPLRAPLLSPRDAALPALRAAENGFVGSVS